MTDIFIMTGVTEPRLDIPAIELRARQYGEVVDAAQRAAEALLDADAKVMEANAGPGADAFHANARNEQGTITFYMDVLRMGAKHTSAAYTVAATEGRTAQDLMHAVALVRGEEYRKTRGAGRNQVLQAARDELLAIESSASAAIRRAFDSLKHSDEPDSIGLPNPYLTRDEDRYGRLDEGIEDEWRKMDSTKRQRVLQCMADKYAASMGFPSTKIHVGKVEDPESLGETDRSSGEVVLNADKMGESAMIGTVIHEMQHRYQVTGRAWRFPWQDMKDGMSRKEAERWDRLTQKHVEWRGGGAPGDWLAPDRYYPRPVELDARRAAREYINEMSHADFEQCAG